MIRCDNCGAQNLDGTVYCDECGRNFTLSSSPQSGQYTVPQVETLYTDTVRLPDEVFDEPVRLARTKQYLARLGLLLRPLFIWRREDGGDPAAAACPFIRNRSKSEAVIPLVRSFRFIHEPVGVTTTSRFVGRRDDLESLAERILFSEGGSFLVTGYRGVGKTSFVNQVVRTLEDALPWAERNLGPTEIVDIYLNIARPVQPSELMHHIIRRLHDIL